MKSMNGNVPWNTGWTVHLHDQYGEECRGYDPQPLDGYIKGVVMDDTWVHLETHRIRFFFIGELENRRRAVGVYVKSGSREISSFRFEKSFWPATYGDLLNLDFSMRIPIEHWVVRDLREPRLAA